MGNSFCFSSDPSSTAGAKPNSVNINKKLEMASKTGVLNLSNHNLTLASPVWIRFLENDIGTKFKSVDISGNKLNMIPIPILNSSINLKNLRACDCQLNRVGSLLVLTKLTSLCLNQNDLDDQSFENLSSSIQKLEVAFNHLSYLPSCVLTLNALVELNIANNRLKDVNGIGKLVSLEVLVLDFNILVEIPEEIGELKKLKHISLKNNRLRKYDKNSEPKLPPCLPERLFTDTCVDNIALEGNAELRTSDVLLFPSIQLFIDRRKRTKDKSVAGGGLTDFELFGLP